MESEKQMLNREIKAYLLLSVLVICGLTSSLITATKVVHIGIDFPFSNIIFSIMTYPIVDCICELWGKQAARQTLWLSLLSQALVAAIIQISIFAPHPTYWSLQVAYQEILSGGIKVFFASLLAFSVSQLLDIVVYQKIKELSQGKWLWLRSNIATYLGQTIDSLIFVNIIFYSVPQKWEIVCGSIAVKILLSFLMTPIVYLIVMTTNKYLDSKTLAFQGK